jgi:hypothetical protein
VNQRRLANNNTFSLHAKAAGPKELFVIEQAVAVLQKDPLKDLPYYERSGV